MMPPSETCKNIFRIDPSIRLAWAGDEHSKELNAGRFILVQLLHKRDLQRTVLERWLPAHGPVYNQYGGTSPDWNYNTHAPVWVGEVTKDDVFTGRCLAIMKQWLGNWKDRQRKNLQQESEKLRDARMDVSEACADEMVWMSNRTGATTPEIIPQKMVPKKDLAVLHGDVDTGPDNVYDERLRLLDKGSP